jgi:hypothetical protein
MEKRTTKLGISLVAALGLIAFAGSAQADILIDMTTDTGLNTGLGTGIQLDVGANITTGLPISADVYDTAPGDLGTEDAVGTLVPGLTLSVVSASSFDNANTDVNASGAGFGLNSPTPDGGSENSARFDVDASEIATLAFNQAVTILSVELGSFSGEETFTFGGVTFGSSNYTGGDLSLADSNDIFTFANGGLVLDANEEFSLQAGGPAGSSVGLVAITIIPEPATLGLIGVSAIGAFAARRFRV